MSGSAMAILMSASTTISLRARDAAITALPKNFGALALSWSNIGSASGAAMVMAPRAACGRLASIARRAFFQAVSGVSSRDATRRSAAVRQPSSASRCLSQLSRTDSACAGVALPLRRMSTSVA